MDAAFDMDGGSATNVANLEQHSGPVSSLPTLKTNASAATIWYRDPVGFLRGGNAAFFLPTQSDTLTEQLNAVMRFAIYFTLVLLLVRRDANLLFVAVVVGALTYVIYESHATEQNKKQSTMEHLQLAREPDGSVCTRPTRDNPFMNVTNDQITDFPNRPAACPITRGDVEAAAEKEFSHNLYRDVEDVAGRYTSSRQFYTMPSTTIPNDRTTFAEWLYKTGPTCKEGNGLQCSMNQSREYLR